MNKLNRVVIFGATSDIAEHVARQLVEQGSSVICVARNTERLDSLIKDLRVRASNSQIVEPYLADLSDINLHGKIWNYATEKMCGCDAVVMAHGILPNQQECEQSVEKTLESIQINALSIISLLTIIANDFEQKKTGVIAVITSVAGDRGRQSNYVYGSAKGMVSLFLQGLRNRLYKSKIDVVNIKPGFTRTRMTEGMNRDSFLWADADQTAKGIIKAMRKGQQDVYLKSIWWLVMLIIKHIPETIFKRLSL